MKSFYPTVAQLLAIETLAIRKAEIAARHLDKISKAAAAKKPKKGASTGGPDIQKVVAAINDFDEDRRDLVAKLMSAALGKPEIVDMIDKDGGSSEARAAPIPGFFSKAGRWALGVAVVPLECNNDHDYDLNEVVFMSGNSDDQGYRVDSDGEFNPGNSLGDTEGAWRPATVAEIKSVIENVRDRIQETDNEWNARNPFGSALTESD
jgi:hypothetical protein